MPIKGAGKKVENNFKIVVDRNWLIVYTIEVFKRTELDSRCGSVW